MSKIFYPHLGKDWRFCLAKSLKEKVKTKSVQNPNEKLLFKA